MDDKAQFYVLESIIAIGMILISIIFVNNFSLSPVVNPQTSTQLKTLSNEALDALKYTDPTDEEIPRPNFCVGRWDFEEGSGNKVNDTSGNSNNGTLFGNAFFTEDSVHGNYAMDFDGNGDYIDCGNDTVLNLTTNFTLSAWVNCENNNTQDNFFFTKGEQFSFAIYNGTGDSNPVSPLNRATILWQDKQTEEFHYFAGETKISNDTWYHLAVTYDGEEVRIYVNGKIDCNPYTVNDIPNATRNPNLTLGGYLPYIPSSSEYYKGKIDNVCIWNVTLDEKEINSSYVLGINSQFEDILTQWIITNDNESFDAFVETMEKMLPSTVFFQLKIFDGDKTYYWYQNDKYSLAKNIVKSHYIISHMTRIYSVELEIWNI